MKKLKLAVFGCFYLCVFSLFLFLSGCAELEKPKPEPFYAETAPPQKKEFRWSNGKMPNSFDPALAAAPPETDIIRAIYEGLTDTNPKTLETIPAVAVDWSASEDYKTWTFILRRDAKWSNGEHVTAEDFVRSWKRLADMGDKAAFYKLLTNIVGVQPSEQKEPIVKEQAKPDLFSRQPFKDDFPPVFKKPLSDPATTQNLEVKPKTDESEKKAGNNIKAGEKKTANKKTEPELKFGVEAVDNFTLKVSLVKSDKDFPTLVANPIFRPVYGDGKYFESNALAPDIITNGAFHVVAVGQDGITLDRSENYWNSRQIELERVHFIPIESAEKALEAYRAGEVDAVTNADFEPLALKLLTPYDDFQRTTHSALNYYEFNSANPLFKDRRIREALAIAIERERLTEDDMDGASRPALTFSPFDEGTKIKLTQDIDKANNLLTQAGYPNGENFPTIRLLINRNNIQQRIAQSVAKMWKDNLNIETEIIVKETSEIDALKNTEDYDLVRRGVVLPTTDETANMLTLFEPKMPISNQPEQESQKEEKTIKTEKPNYEASVAGRTALGKSLSETLNPENSKSEAAENIKQSEIILTEEEAIFALPAIPLYFPTSYSLVKPYIQGFEINTLDAPSLKNVRIDNNWQPNKTKGES